MLLSNVLKIIHITGLKFYQIQFYTPPRNVCETINIQNQVSCIVNGSYIKITVINHQKY